MSNFRVSGIENRTPWSSTMSTRVATDTANVFFVLHEEPRAATIGVDMPLRRVGPGTDAPDVLDDGHELATHEVFFEHLTCRLRYVGKILDRYEFAAIGVDDRNEMQRIGNRKRSHRLDARHALPLGIDQHEATPRRRAAVRKFGISGRVEMSVAIVFSQRASKLAG